MSDDCYFVKARSIRYELAAQKIAFVAADTADDDVALLFDELIFVVPCPTDEEVVVGPVFIKPQVLAI